MLIYMYIHIILWLLFLYIYLEFPTSQWNWSSQEENRWSREKKKTAGVGSHGFWGSSWWPEENEWAVNECKNQTGDRPGFVKCKYQI